MELELPYPPSVNHLWRRVGHRTLISRGGRAFRRAVQAALAARGVRPIAGRLAITIDVYPPDRRRRDLDNALKALLDALQHGGAYHDDAQIDDLHIRRGACVPGGRVCVRIVPHPDPGPAGAEEPPEAPADVPGGAKPRTCLKCGRIFPSAGPGNRICPPCSRKNARIHLKEAELQRQRGAKRHNGELLPPYCGGDLL
jgi:Holliday junction resolvase RusA-like endonuclease